MAVLGGAGADQLSDQLRNRVAVAEYELAVLGRHDVDEPVHRDVPAGADHRAPAVDDPVLVGELDRRLGGNRIGLGSHGPTLEKVYPVELIAAEVGCELDVDGMPVGLA